MVVVLVLLLCAGDTSGLGGASGAVCVLWSSNGRQANGRQVRCVRRIDGRTKCARFKNSNKLI